MTLVPNLHQKSTSGPIKRRTMATYLDSPQGPFVSGSSLPSTLRFSASRLVFCLAVSAAVVIATGITLARMDVPISAVKGSSLTANANPAPITHPAVAAPVAAIHGLPHAASMRTRTARSAQTHSSAEIKTPDAVKPAIFRLNGKEFLVARMVSIKMISIPVAEPAPANVTRASDSAPTALNPAQSSLDGAAKPASL
jgi:hypothetical protein